jgi:hypothetical protein
MALVDQTFITNLKSKVKKELYKVSNAFIIRENNGIICKNGDKDIIRLSSFLKFLETQNTTYNSFDEDLILKVSREYKNYCWFHPDFVVNTQETNSDPTNYYMNNELRIYETNVTSQATVNYTYTNFTLPSTPSYFIDIIIDGFPMQIGNGSRAKEVYFSNDNGSTARNLRDIQIGDRLYINPVIIGTPVETTDIIRIKYH